MPSLHNITRCSLLATNNPNENLFEIPNEPPQLEVDTKVLLVRQSGPVAQRLSVVATRCCSVRNPLADHRPGGADTRGSRDDDALRDPESRRRCVSDSQLNFTLTIPSPHAGSEMRFHESMLPLCLLFMVVSLSDRVFPTRSLVWVIRGRNLGSHTPGGALGKIHLLCREDPVYGVCLLSVNTVRPNMMCRPCRTL